MLKMTEEDFENGSLKVNLTGKPLGTQAVLKHYVSHLRPAINMPSAQAWARWENTLVTNYAASKAVSIDLPNPVARSGQS